MRIFILFISLMTLAGCTAHRDLKSPCGPSASLSQNPCIHIPLNMAAFESREARHET